MPPATQGTALCRCISYHLPTCPCCTSGPSPEFVERPASSGPTRFALQLPNRNASTCLPLPPTLPRPPAAPAKRPSCATWLWPAEAPARCECTHLHVVSTRHSMCFACCNAAVLIGVSGAHAHARHVLPTPAHCALFLCRLGGTGKCLHMDVCGCPCGVEDRSLSRHLGVCWTNG